jgi:transaldolase
MTRLDALYLERGQSPWIDNIRRDWLTDGTLSRLVDRGVRGVTSNPSIFARALSTSTQYDKAIAASRASSAEELFEELAVDDVRDACDVLAEVHRASVREFTSGVHRYCDGFVSLEVSPRLAYDAAATVAAAERLAQTVNRPNLLVKVPATIAGLAAIRECAARGISVNVTLIFSLERYGQVMDAHLAGLADALAAGHDLSSIASVASFFVSRVDTAADPLLESAAHLRGHGANAQAAAAYERYVERFARDDAIALLKAGAQVQRPLWASTSTKNPDYDELLYVDALVAPETVNTMPDATLEAYCAREASIATSIADPATRAAMCAELDELREHLDLDALTNKLESDGVRVFEDSYLELLATVSDKLGA